MRLLALAAVCVLLAWLALSGPSVEPLKPDPRVPTFHQVNGDQPPEPAPVHESADRQRLVQAIMNAANRLENSPCDKTLRQPFRAAVAAYMSARSFDDPISQETNDIIREGAMAGILQAGDLFGDRYKIYSALTGKSDATPATDHSSYNGRFACRIGND